MKTASAGLIALLNSGAPLITADLYTITLTDGMILYYTNADIDIIYGGNTYLHRPAIKRSNLTFTEGISVDSLDVNINPESTDLIGSITMSQAFRNGTFDGAILQLDKAFFTDWTQTPEVLEKLFLGRMDVDTIGASGIKVDVKSMTELLNVAIPKRVYQATCPWTLYDSSTCKAVKASFSSNGTVASTSTETVINCGLAQAAGYFDQGVILFTSGANLNVKRSVKSYTAGQITLINPLQYAPSVNDTFTISRGCARTMTD